MQTEIYRLGIGISALTIAEMGTSLARRVHEGVLTRFHAQASGKSFRRDLRSFLVVDLQRPTLNRAFPLASRSLVPLRALDAVQLQCALELATVARKRGRPMPRFITADTRLELAAKALDFVTDNPLHHP